MLRNTFICLLTAFGLILTGCNQPMHPGAINQFDSTTYDSFLVAHAALTSLRIQVSSTYPKYSGQFDTAAASYQTAYNSYGLFRSAPTANQAQVAQAINALTTSIIALENAIQADLNVPVATRAKIKLEALKKLRKHDFSPDINLQTILTELEIAAAVAEAVPGTAPYAALASIVIEATQEALSALSANSGLPIDMTQIAPIPVIAAATK